MRGGRQVTAGRSSGRQLTRRPFSKVDVDFPGRRTFLTLDAGLIEIDDVGDWTSRTFGLPATGELADLNELNISLRQRTISSAVRVVVGYPGERSTPRRR